MLKYILFVFAILAVTPAYADASKPDWGNCSTDIAKFKCKEAKSDEEIYTCLIKHDGELSKACDPETTTYEKLTGKPQ